MNKNKVIELIAEGQDLNIDELIELRKTLRETKNYKFMDVIRNYLDTRLVFIFDSTWGQEVYFLTERYFRFKDKFEQTKLMTNRKYVEYRIQQESRSERMLDAWIYTVRGVVIDSKPSVHT